MARENLPVLDTGVQFPSFEVDTAGGGHLCLPTDYKGYWSVIMFCRGEWCRQDRQQLLDYELRTDVFSRLGIKVAALFAEHRSITKLIVRSIGRIMAQDAATMVEFARRSKGR